MFIKENVIDPILFDKFLALPNQKYLWKILNDLIATDYKVVFKVFREKNLYEKE